MRNHRLFIGITLILLILTACQSQSTATSISPSPAAVVDLGPVEFVWSVTGDPAPFHTPNGLAVDAQGNLYVVDTLNHQIKN